MDKKYIFFAACMSLFSWLYRNFYEVPREDMIAFYILAS